MESNGGEHPFFAPYPNYHPQGLQIPLQSIPTYPYLAPMSSALLPPPQQQHQLKLIEPHDVTLVIRQQPREALVTAVGREKARKPVDPPPIVQLHLTPDADT